MILAVTAETPMRPVATLVVAALSVAVATAAARPAFADATIDSLTTHLYYHHTGTVDDREASGLQLWNTMIGGGDAKAASATTIVHVAVSGAETLDRGSVELVARAGKKRVFKQRVSLDDYVAVRGKAMVVPFVLYGTGCQSLAVTATVTAGKRTVGGKTVVLPFACGE
jgi:hypothetical protein